MKKHKLISSNSCLINKLYVYFLTLTVPEQEQGASKVLVLSNSSSWQILQREIPESSFKSSTSNTISPIFLKRRQPMIFFSLKFQRLFSNSVSCSVFLFFFVLSLYVFLTNMDFIYERKKETTFEFQYCPSIIINKYEKCYSYFKRDITPYFTNTVCTQYYNNKIIF